ncbi:MAG: nucleotide exchange factor GrpE [Acidobacteriota bacterium]
MAENEMKENLDDETTTETVEEKDVQVLQEQLQAEKAKAEENYNKYLRALADAENQRKRWQKEREDLVKYGSLPVLRRLFPVLDDFRRARDAAEKGGDMASLLKGVELIEKRLVEVVEAEGAQAITAVGEQFDPVKHEALTTEETDQHPDGTIIEEFRTGYMLGERVARPSLVKVAQNSN